MKKMTKKKHLSLIFAALLAVGVLAGCGGSSDDTSAADQPIGEQLDHAIQGIDPGAGIMSMTRDAIKEYGLSDWTLNEASDAAMMAELDKKYKKKEPIIITGWTPHWMFEAYDLKYLEDPKLIYGEEEEVDTIVRQGLEEDEPTAYAFLDKFSWEPSDMQQVMNDTRDTSSEAAAKKWVNENSDKVDEWVDGLDKVDGKTLKIAFVAWDSEVATSNVVRTVLQERLGYKVDLVQLDNGTMWASVAKGDSDAMVSAWLPSTHEEQYKRFKDELVNLGPNLKGTKLGLVVPTYMEDINSIEDLKDK